MNRPQPREVAAALEAIGVRAWQGAAPDRAVPLRGLVPSPIFMHG